MPSLYCSHFQLEETPFSIAPDPRFVFLSERHREALGHLLFGLAEGGGFVQLTGEVGTGKTTICRTLLCQLPDNVDVALIFNPKLTVLELLQSVCEELHVEPPVSTTSAKAFVDRLHHYLLDAHAKGRRTVLIIDEAQNLSGEVLEQIRLLTNLETNDSKLLQVFLIGQPELRSLLGRDDLRQLAQRVTARYHLEPLDRAETLRYIEHRLSVAGCRHKVFTDAALRKIYKLTGGIPRLVNSLCDRALLGAFATDHERIDTRIVARANRELRGESGRSRGLRPYMAPTAAALAGMVLVAVLGAFSGHLPFAHIFAAASSTVEVDASSPSGSGTDNANRVRSVATADSDAATDDPLVQTAARAERNVGSHAAGLPSPSSRHDSRRPRSLLEVIESIEDDGALRSERRLLALWGVREAVPGGDICRRAGERGFACLAGTGSWSKLRGFDLPALLRLEGGSNGPIQVLLGGLVGQTATLYIGEEEQRFPLHEVDRYWTGEFLVLWKPPEHGATVIRPSHSGAAVQWLRDVFARLDGTELGVQIDGDVDQALSARIKTFQRLQGLEADGVVGPETLIHLSALANDPRVPTLSAAARTMPADAAKAARQLSKLTSP